MAIVFENWLATNEQRAYPLNDAATRRASDGATLPNDILTDVHIYLPESAGKSVYVSSVGVTAGLVSVTFLATPNNPLEPGGPAPGTPVPVAAVRATLPITPYRNYPLEALYPGVSGWVSFGTGANKQACHLLFDPEASWLCARCVREARELPVSSVGKYGFSAKLKGLVRLSGSDNISITKERRIIDGEEKDALVFALKVPDNSNLQAVLKAFADPCDNRPAEGTCRSPGLRSINEVKPDGNGNVSLIFQYGYEIIGDSGDGLVLDYPLGLSEACKPKTYTPYPATDECEPSESSSSSAQPSSSSSSSESSSSVIPPTESSSSGLFCSTLSADFGILQPIYDDGAGEWIFDDSIESGTRLMPKAGSLTHYIANSQSQFRIFNDLEDIVVSGLIRPKDATGEGHLIFGYQTANNFYFGGLTLQPSFLYPGGRFFIGRKASGGPSWPNGLGLGYNFIPGAIYSPPVALQPVDYDISLRIRRVSSTTAQARISATWIDPSLGAQAYVSSWIGLTSINTESFKVGLGAVLSTAVEFADWCVDGGRLY